VHANTQNNALIVASLVTRKEGILLSVVLRASSGETLAGTNYLRSQISRDHSLVLKSLSKGLEVNYVSDIAGAQPQNIAIRLFVLDPTHLKKPVACSFVPQGKLFT
jgi:hypothetical protein